MIYLEKVFRYNYPFSMVVFVHGKGGNIGEAEAFRSVFPDEEFLSLDYHSTTPWDFRREVRSLLGDSKDFTLIAISIGAYFFLSSGLSDRVKEAFFISPVSDMEKLILGMMEYSGVTEEELKEKGNIGELSYEYLTYARSHRMEWNVKTHAIAGSLDEVMDISITRKIFPDLTVLEGSYHYLHTPEEKRRIVEWMKSKVGRE